MTGFQVPGSTFQVPAFRVPAFLVPNRGRGTPNTNLEPGIWNRELA